MTSSWKQHEDYLLHQQTWSLSVLKLIVLPIGDSEVPNGPKVRLYTPTGSQEPHLPIVVFAHGGGWYAGNLDTEDRTCRMVSSMVPACVVSVEYRCDFDVALEDMVDDLYSAFEWTRGNNLFEGADNRKMVLWGGSAGGTLVTSLVYRLIQDGKAGQVVGLVSMDSLHLHPNATPQQYKHLNTSYIDNAGPLPFVSGEDIFDLYRHRNIEPPKTELSLFPAAGGADYLKGFPPTYIISSDNDAARDDSTVFEAALKDAGARVKRDNIKGLAHYFWSFDLPMANTVFWDKLTNGMRWTLSS
ncbi:hypothetical protein LTR37_006926 [Vermiconidia calcicola]|uniref:Uncharacterized protein n=1 Tax=Vermiconidia calcicola TaxID=1690605 RepID=A0ACC3NF56_9PEZI|nr:hypothetical protein LTR37_006926 [Vermiconidia calcicola]